MATRERFRRIWQRTREWPLPAQLLFVLLVLIVAGLVSGGISSELHTTSHPERAATATTRAPAATRVPTTTRATTTTGPPAPSLASTTTHATTTTRATTPTSPTTRGGTARLIPLRVAPQSHQASYDRDADFGGWIDQNGCQDTRAVLLIHTSKIAVTFTNSRDCTVATGRWIDPWSGRVTTVAHTFQIDHTVPLANAWASGAWSWTHAQRIAYANDLADADHLVPILAGENESKGDDGPDGWRPPSRSAWCRYALDWDRIKATWHLSATVSEWNAVVEMAATC